MTKEEWKSQKICWNCHATENLKRCPGCKNDLYFALYCDEECRLMDIYRHMKGQGRGQPYCYIEVSLYLRIPLVGRYVFICFHSFHSQFLQFDLMPSISVLCTVGFYYLETRSVFIILHASYLHFHTLLSYREKYLLGFKNISVFLLCKVLIYVLCQQCNECIS